jgi:hypothetical protein
LRRLGAHAIFREFARLASFQGRSLTSGFIESDHVA